ASYDLPPQAHSVPQGAVDAQACEATPGEGVILNQPVANHAPGAAAFPAAGTLKDIVLLLNNTLKTTVEALIVATKQGASPTVPTQQQLQEPQPQPLQQPAQHFQQQARCEHSYQLQQQQWLLQQQHLQHQQQHQPHQHQQQQRLTFAEHSYQQ
ncbi:unnamed protein product, partial [Polarella glacialis]